MSRNIYGRNPHYKFRDRDPVLAEMRGIWKLSGLPLKVVADNAGMHYSTLYNWFVAEKTISPRHDNVKIFYASFGISYGRQDQVRLRRAA